MKKLGAEAILFGMAIPWIVWTSLAIFNSQKVEAVQETKYHNIIEKLDDLKKDNIEIKKKLEAKRSE